MTKQEIKNPSRNEVEETFLQAEKALLQLEPDGDNPTAAEVYVCLEAFRDWCLLNRNEPWCSVDARLPTESGRYLAWCIEQGDLGKSEFALIVCYNPEQPLNTWSDGGESYHVTHWKLLPTKPDRNE